MARTAVVILNWNTAGFLSRFIPGLLKSLEGLDAEAIVADNGSTDDSLEVMAKEFPEVRVIALDRNYGFTGGYDRALAQVEAEFFVLLNTDVDVPKGWLEPLVDWMDSHPDCAACGPKILALGDDFSHTTRFEYAGAAGGLLTRHGFPYCRGRVLSRTEEDHGQYDTAADVKWVSGACFLTRSGVWRELGGLDDRFFAHMEEIDYCWRARKEGWKITCVPASKVWHLGGGTLKQDSPFKLKLNFRNSLLMLEKCQPGLVFTRMIMDGCIAVLYLLSGHKEKFDAVVQAHKEFKSIRNENRH